MSRLSPPNWPKGTGTVLFLGWLAYTIATAVWIPALLWTVLPIGLTLYLVAAWYPWRVIVLFVVPLTVITASSRLVALSPEAPIWVAIAIYLVACGYFSFIVAYENLDRWVARLPTWLLGERFAARLAWTRFEESLVAANALVRQVAIVGADGDRQAALQQLAITARREARRGVTWHDAWVAHATWLDGLAELVDTETGADTRRHVSELLADMDRAHMQAIERTTDADPVPG